MGPKILSERRKKKEGRENTKPLYFSVESRVRKNKERMKILIQSERENETER